MARGDGEGLVGNEDAVLSALMRAPLDDLPESEEERRAVAAAKASRRMRSHASISAALAAALPEVIEARRSAG